MRARMWAQGMRLGMRLGMRVDRDGGDTARVPLGPGSREGLRGVTRWGA